jgi:hypothetical protein
MNAANSPSHEYFQPCHFGQNHGCSDSCATVFLFGNAGCQVPSAAFASIASLFGEEVDLAFSQPDVDFAQDYSDCGWSGVLAADDLFHRKSGFEVLRVGHSVSYYGGF